MAKLAWKPWHEVVKLRDDLLSGELPMHLFAADLYEVLMQRGKRSVYEKPEQFFALTYPTYNLRQLARDVMQRLAGKNDKAVRQLDLTYGGGKTHTLITLRHLVNDPDNLPDLPSVQEFIQEIGRKPPKCRIAGLCFDKLDVESGMEVCAPDGSSRMLIQPWSVLAYQIAGDEGLKILHPKQKAEERESAPAEPLLTQLLEHPLKEGLGTLLLFDEVLMYAREKVRFDAGWEDSLVNFFQYLTQAAAKIDRCCVVASLLATDPAKLDATGKRILERCREVFSRQQEEIIQPVEKQDVAEVLRRRFFKPESLKTDFRPHVIAALKGIQDLDGQTRKDGVSAEDRFVKSYPFHPELTEVLYEKWTDLPNFQKTRGVLRTFALALRESAAWDTSPLVSTQVFLNAPGDATLTPSARELVVAANSQNQDGGGTNWGPLLEGEFARAMLIQKESVGLKYREIEQAVMATFLYSQPTGHTAKTGELAVLIAATRPDKIELEKGLARWAQLSHWLDDLYTAVSAGDLPLTWRLGNRPNLTQMHAVAAKNIADEIVRSRLIDEIGRVKALTNNASAAGVRVHTLPTRPRDIEDDGAFHYAILGLSAASESGKPSPEAKKFLEETTGADRPRVYRNSVLLLVPSKDGCENALARVREYLAWNIVLEEIKQQQRDGAIDAARAQTLRIYIDTARGKISDAIKQAYCIVVTVSEKDDIQAFKITVTEEPHFNIIKADKKSRVQDTAVTAEALLPGSPYDLWKSGETSRRVKDLAGAFAQLPHLPKMLKASAILDTLADGCEKGTFVLRLIRPDGSSRSWWMTRPDQNALNDPALELVLPEAAELAELTAGLLAPQKLPQLWQSEEITVNKAIEYFDGTTVVQVERDGYPEPIQIPKASCAAVEKAISAAVENGYIWLVSGPASIFGEQIPLGILNDSAILREPPQPIAAAEILPENLPGAWADGSATGLSIATALSVTTGKTLPWKTIKDVINGALQARFLEINEGSQSWPCDFPTAQFVTFKQVAGDKARAGAGGGGQKKVYVVNTELEPSQIQELGDKIPELLQIKNKAGIPLSFHVRIELGDGKTLPPSDVTQKINTLLDDVKKGMKLS